MPGVLAWTQPLPPHCQSQAPRRPHRGPTHREGRVTAPSDEEDTQGPCHTLQARGPERPTEVGTSRTGRGVPWSSLVTATLVQVPESEVTSPEREGRDGQASTKDRGHSASCSETAVGATPPNLGAAAAGLEEGRKRPGQLPALPSADLMWTEELPWATARLGVSLLVTLWPPRSHTPGPTVWAPEPASAVSLLLTKPKNTAPVAHLLPGCHVWPRPHKVGEPCLEEGSLQTSSS